MPPNKGAAGRKKDAIHFVNARPSSEGERLKIQRLVRAHVGKWISDQTKDRSIESEANSSRDASRENASRTVDLDGDETMLNLYPPSLSCRSSVSSCSPESVSSNNSLTVIQTVPTSAWDAQQTMSVVPTSQLYLDSTEHQYDNEYEYD